MRIKPVIKWSLLIWVVWLELDLPGALISDPLGARVVEIRGNGATTLLSLGGFHREVTHSGEGEVLPDGRLEDSLSSWEVDGFAGTHFLALSDGTWSPIEANSETVLELEWPIAPHGSVEYRILPLDTLDGTFGADNASGFIGGPHIGEADILISWDNLNQRVRGLYYYNSETAAWLDSYDGPAGSVILYPDECLIVIGWETHNIILTGWVQTHKASGVMTGNGSTNLLPNPYPFDLPIGSSGLEQYVSGGMSVGTADLVVVFDPLRQLASRILYFNTAAQSWVDATEAPVGDEDVIPAGSAVIVIRHSAGQTSWQLNPPLNPEVP